MDSKRIEVDKNQQIENKKISTLWIEDIWKIFLLPSHQNIW